MSGSPAEFTVGPGASESLKQFCAAFEEYHAKPNTTLRKTGYAIADTNGSGQASLAEIENFIKAALQNAHEDDSVSDRLFAMYRPSYRHAFNNAKKLRKDQSSSPGDDYVSYAEFRVFTIYLCIYASMFDIFCNVDGGEARNANDDSRIDLEEFLKYTSSFDGYNFIALKGISSTEDATDLFQRIDSDDGGKLLFSEWSTFIKSWEIRANSAMGVLLSGNLKPTRLGTAQSNRTSTPASNMSGRRNNRSARSTSAKSAPNRKVVNATYTRPTSTRSSNTPMMPTKVSGAYSPSRNSSKELVLFIKSFQPLAEKTSTGTQLRRKVFSACDGNGTGQCSLAEIDSFVQSRLKLELGMKRWKAIFVRFRSCYIRAFNAAKDISKSSGDYVTFAEFRLLNAYLCIFAGMYDIFTKLDGGGQGITIEDDRRISEKEFVSGYACFKDCGFVCLTKIKRPSNAKTAFANMDADKKGQVLLIEFCEYIQMMEVRAGTALGKLFDIRPSSRSAPQDPSKRSTRSQPSESNHANASLPPMISKKAASGDAGVATFEEGLSFDDDDDSDDLDLGPTAAKKDESDTADVSNVATIQPEHIEQSDDVDPNAGDDTKQDDDATSETDVVKEENVPLTPTAVEVVGQSDDIKTDNGLAGEVNDDAAVGTEPVDTTDDVVEGPSSEEVNRGDEVAVVEPESISVAADDEENVGDTEPVDTTDDVVEGPSSEVVNGGDEAAVVEPESISIAADDEEDVEDNENVVEGDGSDVAAPEPEATIDTTDDDVVEEPSSEEMKNDEVRTCESPINDMDSQPVVLSLSEDVKELDEPEVDIAIETKTSVTPAEAADVMLNMGD